MSDLNTVLAIDTSMAGCSVAVYDRAKDVSSSKIVPMTRGQAEALVPLVDQVMEQAGVIYADLDAVLATRGPGAFTGLRIGISTAKSLALALGIPAFGVTSLQVLAFDYAAKEKSESNCAVIIETKRSDFYFQPFDGQGHAVSEAELLSAEVVIQKNAGFTCIGDGLKRLTQESDVSGLSVKEGYDLPDMAVSAENLAKAADPDVFSAGIEPLYLRAPDVSFSKKEQRILA